MRKNQLFLLMTIIVLSLCFSQQLRAQAVYGSVSGTVTDSTGAVVPDATVTITSVERNASDTVMTNSDGLFVKERLLPGNYTVKIEKTGFKTGQATGVVVNVDTQTSSNITLETGEVSEIVTVALEGDLLKTDRADVATTFTQRQVSELPIIDRNFTKLILLTPGTQQQLWNHAASENPQGSTQTIVNGQTFSGTGYQLDGTDNRDVILGIIVINPTFDSVGETKITSSNYDAEFGQAIAGVASVQTKSGTNDFRGSAFYYLQRDRFQARNPIDQARPDPVTRLLIPKSKRDQFGGSIGGPIIKDRFFFFGDYQGTRTTQGRSKTLTVPTALARTGNLSQYGVTIFNPTTYNPATNAATPYAGNIIPACGAGQTPSVNGCLSTQALTLINRFPAPTNSGVINNFVASGSEVFDNDIFNIRLDGRLTENLNIFGRFSRGKFSLIGPTAFGELGGPELVSLGGSSKTRNISLATGFDYIFNPTTIVDMRFGFFNYKPNVLPFDYGTTPATAAGIPGLNFDDFSSGLFAGFINVNGPSGSSDINFGSGLGVNRCNCPLDQDEKQYQVVTNLTKIVGNHTMKFGVDVRRAFNLRVPSDNHRSGELTFGQNRTGLGLATFLIGDVTSFRRYVSTSTDARESQWRHFYYAQDTWRATPKLTVAFGLRADIINPQTLNEAGNGGFPDLNTGEIIVAGVGDNNLAGNIKNKVNFAPRLGIAYQLNDKMVIRGGFGRSFDTGVFGTVFGHTVTQNIPVLAVQNLTESTINSQTTILRRVFNLATGPAAPTGFFGITTLPNRCPVTGCVQNTSIPSNGRFFIPDGITVRSLTDQQTLPRVDAFNITFQYQFAKDWSLEAAYVGNRGKNVFVGDNPDLNVNQATLVGYGSNGVTPDIPINQRKPYFQKFGWTQDILLYQGYGATNRYDSLQVKVNKRFSTGYSILTHYTNQKSTNNAGEQFIFDPDLNRGEADFNRRHIFVFTQLYELPIGRNRKFFSNINRVADAFIGGWQVNSNTTWQSGFPFNVTYEPCRQIPNPADPTTTLRQCDRDTGPSRPNVNGEINYTPGQKGTIDASVFSKPAIGTFGNLERNAIHGPGYFRTDASIFKRFFFTERLNLELRLEVVNLFNTVNLGNPDSNLGSFTANGVLVPNANFGRSTQTAFFGGDPMRNLQFAARFNF